MDVNKLHTDKLETRYVDSSKLSNIRKNGVAKETVYDEFVKKSVDTSDLVKKLSSMWKLMTLKTKFLIILYILLLTISANIILMIQLMKKLKEN